MRPTFRPSRPLASPDIEPIRPAECDGAGVICVNATAAAGGAGTTDAPFRSVAEALSAAADGAQIQVAAGVYAENLTLEGRRDLVLAGGFAGVGAGERDPAANETSLQPAGGPAVQILGSSGIRIDGFHISGGTGRPAGDRNEGGGILIDEGSSRIDVVGNVIAGNALTGTKAYEDRGGGILSYGSELRIVGNVIADNRAGLGAGIFHVGGNALLDGNVVEGNVGVGDHGGGLYLGADDSGGAELRISRNLIRGNTTGIDNGYGGGLLVLGASTAAYLEGNVVTDNHAPTIGSGVFVDEEATATLTGELYYRNRCPKQGGAGLAVDGGGGGGSEVVVINATIADHECATDFGGNAVYADGASRVSVSSSIFWNNGGDLHSEDGSTIQVSYTLADPTIEGTGNVTGDPLFADATAGDYHVRSAAGRFDPMTGGWVTDDVTSPTIDAADPARDASLEPVPNGGRANLGHTGTTAEASKSG